MAKIADALKRELAAIRPCKSDACGQRMYAREDGKPGQRWFCSYDCGQRFAEFEAEGRPWSDRLNNRRAAVIKAAKDRLI